MFYTNVTGFDARIWILLKHVTYFIKNLKYFQKTGQFLNLRVAPSGGGIGTFISFFLQEMVFFDS